MGHWLSACLRSFVVRFLLLFSEGQRHLFSVHLLCFLRLNTFPRRKKGGQDGFGKGKGADKRTHTLADEASLGDTFLLPHNLCYRRLSRQIGVAGGFFLLLSLSCM